MKDLNISNDPASGQVTSVLLYGRELLNVDRPCQSELWVNGSPLTLRPHRDSNDPSRELLHLKGERWVDHFCGWSLVLRRQIGPRDNAAFPCVGIQTLVRREFCDQTLPSPGPGGPPIEAPLYVDTFSVLNWNWKFWGDSTRMIFPSAHSSGPIDEFGHAGHEDDTPENVKKYLRNVWRRIYPGCLLVPGGLFYDSETGQWLAITCRRPQVGYIINIADSGRGVSYDFALHATFGLGESLTLPEIKLYYGADRDSMMRWLGHFITYHVQEPPDWVFRTLMGPGLAWDNQPTWKQQAEHWVKELDQGNYTGLSYSLVTNRPVQSGTTPLGYEPDPNHGTLEEFQAMCHTLSDRQVPLLIWMSHSGLCYRGGPDIDDDWFIRGIDGRLCAAWGSIDAPEIVHINPGHPGYIEYTKKWIRFYIKECRCKGIFLDCLSWAFPPDFAPRDFMRFPGDTNRMAVKFVEEVYRSIKECDKDAILMGEGSSVDFPVNIYSIHSNPVRNPGGLGPRDFLLGLNAYAPKRLCVDQGPQLFPGGGYCYAATGERWGEHNRYLARLLREKGGRAAFVALPGDLSVLADEEGDMLFVPVDDTASVRNVVLPKKWDEVLEFKEVITGNSFVRNQGGNPPIKLPPGFYRMK